MAELIAMGRRVETVTEQVIGWGKRAGQANDTAYARDNAQLGRHMADISAAAVGLTSVVLPPAWPM